LNGSEFGKDQQSHRCVRRNKTHGAPNASSKYPYAMREFIYRPD